MQENPQRGRPSKTAPQRLGHWLGTESEGIGGKRERPNRTHLQRICSDLPTCTRVEDEPSTPEQHRKYTRLQTNQITLHMKKRGMAMVTSWPATD